MSKNCYVNSASKILKDYKVEPYIWMTATQRKLFQETEGKKGLGVGIACIPELIRGMRTCMKKNLTCCLEFLWMPTAALDESAKFSRIL